MPGQSWDSRTFQPPEWMAEELTADCLIPAGTQAEISEFGYADAQTLTLVGAATAGSGVVLTLATALIEDIVSGIVLDFGSGKLATLEEKGERGATTITVTLAADTVGGESAVFPGIRGQTVVRSGVLVGRTYAERAAGTGYGPADVASDDQIYLVAFQAEYLERDAGITLVRHRAKVYENKLPGWADMSAAEQARIRELYDCLLYPV